MKILLDAHYIGSQAGGNETYTRSLVEGLRHADCRHDVTLLMDPSRVSDPITAGFKVRSLHLHSAYLRVPFVLPYEALRAQGRPAAHAIHRAAVEPLPVCGHDARHCRVSPAGIDAVP
jgi:hypothetical protein